MALQEIKKDAQGIPTGLYGLIAGGTLWADAPVGVINAFGGTTAPEGWLLCQGQAISRTDYADLFAVIGTAFGSGDGSTTFNVPDMREAVPKGAGETGQTVGAHVKSGGLAVGEFLDDRLQSHKHLLFEWSNGTGAGPNSTLMWNNGAAQTTGNTTNGINEGREGNTTEVKAVGVNYIIKAVQIALPADLQAAIEDMNLITYGG